MRNYLNGNKVNGITQTNRVPKLSDFSKEELEEADLLLRHIEGFASPQKEYELVRMVMQRKWRYNFPSKAA